MAMSRFPLVAMRTSRKTSSDISGNMSFICFINLGSAVGVCYSHKQKKG